MRVVRFDSVGGASGDMLLGALLGLGLNPAALSEELEQLLPGHFRIHFEPHCSWGISGVRAHVELIGGDHHEHDHGHHGHEHTHDNHHEPEHHEHHNCGEILALIGHSALPEPVKAMSRDVFQLLARAEGKIHGVAPDAVCFHEVGAVDSIIDIVGCCLAYHRLGLDGISVSSLPTGIGTTRCRHGVIPIPAPATAEILKISSLAVSPCDEPFELLTPTGAALLAVWPKLAVPAGVRLKMTVNSFGSRTLNGRANLLRSLLFEAENPAHGVRDVVEELECNLDDCPGETLGFLMDRLFAAGALDVWYEPVMMKKQRPGVKLGALVSPEKREAVLSTIFRESTTFGVRIRPTERRILEREFVEVETPVGPIRIKVGRLGGAVVSVKPEYEDCRRAAEATGTPLSTVIRQAAYAFAVKK